MPAFLVLLALGAIAFVWMKRTRAARDITHELSDAPHDVIAAAEEHAREHGMPVSGAAPIPIR